VVAEDYSYKTECYYTLLSRELSGEPVDPDSQAVLDAAVVPLCSGGLPGPGYLSPTASSPSPVPITSRLSCTA